MLRIDELLERLGVIKFLSTLNLMKGYWKIPLKPEAKEKTAFSTPWGLYQFKTMSFRLHGDATTFQQLMDQML